MSPGKGIPSDKSPGKAWICRWEKCFAKNHLNNRYSCESTIDWKNPSFTEQEDELESDVDDDLREVADLNNVAQEIKGESDVQLLINKMENKKMYASYFTFEYKVENSELVAMFWADEVSKCNYKEFVDIVSFDATFNSKKKRYRQEALDFKTLDEVPKCETKLAIEHHAARVYTRTIFLLVQNKINEGCWSCTIQDSKINEGCETAIGRDKAANSYRTLNTKNGKEQKKESKTVAETVIDYKDEVKADVPNPPSRNTVDVIGAIFAISKPNQLNVQNPTKPRNKGEHFKKGERLKSEREKALKVRAKLIKIVLHEINVHARKMLQLAKEFDNVDPLEKMSIIIEVVKNREQIL
nr:protein FAR1-related sequence 5-like [Tanacetum cinerariifolium]